MRPQARHPGYAGRSRRTRSRGRNALALINRWRVAGLLLAAASATWAAWLVTSHQFDLDPARVEVSSLVYTQPDLIHETIDLSADARPNVFRIDTGQMERNLAALPAVANADVYVTLPDRLVIRVTERTPTFVLKTPIGAFVVDVDGFILDELPVADATSLGLPIVSDLRDRFAPEVEVGGRLDAVSLDADLRLAAITPTMIGTSYDRLSVTADDTDGYIVAAEPDGWRAVFGHYTPNLRPVDIIDQQVQCLRAQVAAGEDDVAIIYLAPLDERCGTFLPRMTPAESATPTPAS